MNNEGVLTGLPSVDRPWMKYYSEEAVNVRLPQGTVYEYLYECNCEHIEDVAINYYGDKITYRQFFKDIDRAAAGFAEHGIARGSIVTIVTLSCYASVVCFYALNRIGAVSNFVNVLSSKEDIRTYVRDADSAYVICLDLFAKRGIDAVGGMNVREVIYISLEMGMPLATKIGYRHQMRKFSHDFEQDDLAVSFDALMKEANALDEAVISTEAGLCCLAHTGGTTGFPKSVLLNDNALNAIAAEYNASMQHERGEVFLCTMIPYVIYGLVTNIHMPLCLGLTTVIVPKFEPEKWSIYIKKYGVNHFAAIPAYVSALIENKNVAKMDLSGLKTVALGGDGMNNTLEERINSFLAEHGCSVEMVMGYGMSEVCASAVTRYNYAHKLGSVGIPFVKNNIMAYDNDGECECGYNQTGEICLQAATEMMGYKDNVEDTQKLIRIHPDGSRWIHTGDMGYIDEDGFLFLTGRMKRMIMTVIDGAVYKLFPSQVENVISTCPDVADVCVVGGIKGTNRVLRAYIVRNPHFSGSDEQLESYLRNLCRVELADHMQPYFYEFIDKMPLTPAGKVDYKKLSEGENEAPVHSCDVNN